MEHLFWGEDTRDDSTLHKSTILAGDNNRGIKTLYPEQTIAPSLLPCYYHHHTTTITTTITIPPPPPPPPPLTAAAAATRLSGNDNVRLRHYQLNGKQWRY
uniref:Uncharacterized protein n=1 Tax=Vespula pensylvanica TaxID=30213 RepID=A0A834UHY5_VESPE|nr:hypothetical protein H0235_001879 [Vespula pensylvanica]